MINEVESYKVAIFDDEYIIASDEGRESVSQLAQRVDGLMNDIAHRLGSVDAKRIAVLAAFKLAHQLQELEGKFAKQKHDESHLVDLINRELSSLST